MWRNLLKTVLLAVVASAIGADKPEAPRGSNAGVLELSLPESVPPPDWGPDQVSRLEIDGKDVSTPRLTKRSLKVEPKKGSDSVTVVYTYWPAVYIRITSTRVVKVEKGKTVKVDFEKPDPAHPDKI